MFTFQNPLPVSPLLILAVILVMVLLKKGLMIIRQSERVVVERLGRYHRTLMPGINFLMPILDKPRHIQWKDLTPNAAPRLATAF